MSAAKKNIAVFVLGGLLYGLIEILWRSYTHWTMLITGGICLLLLYNLYTKHSQLNLPLKCLLGACIITAVEFCVGCIVNLWLGMNVWDYSALPFNIYGQVCLLFSCMWLFISGLAVPLCSMLDKLLSNIKWGSETKEISDL